MTSRLSDEGGLEKAVERLKKINSEIGKLCTGKAYANMSGTEHEISYNQVIRSLTKNEWEEIKKLIKEFDLPCLLQSTAYSFALAIHEHHDLQVELPRCVLWIEYSQLPISRDAKNELVSQESVIEQLVEIVYTPRNKEVIAWYGFPSLKKQPELYAY
ncbi:MAG: hypothetical protein Q7S34_03345 [bacterium]|nr:hypothetical protein [bacterium]